jgi:hypothetical protein
VRLQDAPPAYDAGDQRQMRAAVMAADKENLKQGEAIDEAAAPIVRTSPDGTRWIMGVSDAGMTTWTAE